MVDTSKPSDDHLISHKDTNSSAAMGVDFHVASASEDDAQDSTSNKKN